MAITQLDEGIEILAGRMRITQAVIYAVMAISGLVLIGETLGAAGMLNYAAMELGTLETFFGLADLAFLAIYLVSVVLVSMWIYRAHANLLAAGHELEFTPGWAVGWYFIPIMNLFKPFQAMKELWNTSHNQINDYSGETAPDVGFWWATFVASNILGNVSFRLQNAANYEGSGGQIGAAVGAASTALLIVCAWKLLGLIRQVTDAQQSGLGTAEVFA